MFGGRSYTVRTYWEKSRSRDTILYGEPKALRAGLIAAGILGGGPLGVAIVYAMFHPDPHSPPTGAFHYVVLTIFLLFTAWIGLGVIHRALSPRELSLDRRSRAIRFSCRPFLWKKRITLFEASEVQAVSLSAEDPANLELILSDGRAFPVDRCTNSEDLRGLARSIADTLGVVLRDSTISPKA